MSAHEDGPGAFAIFYTAWIRCVTLSMPFLKCCTYALFIVYWLVRAESPMVAFLNKRLRAVKKKLRNVEGVEKARDEGKAINEQQQAALNSKDGLKALETELVGMLASIKCALVFFHRYAARKCVPAPAHAAWTWPQARSRRGEGAGGRHRVATARSAACAAARRRRRMVCPSRVHSCLSRS